MPRNGSGQYNPLTNTWNPPVTGVLATGADFQAQLNDISAAITQSVSKDGQTPMTANLPMGNNSIVGIASGTVTTPSISANGDTNTGLYFPAADTIGVAVGGVQKAVFGTGSAVIDGMTVGKGGGAVSSNTAIGLNALAINTTGNYNTASGVDALKSNTTGGSNTASGVNALKSNTTGNYNTASGVNALYSNTTGSLNTASGVDALLYNTEGINNTASGVSALLFNTTGNYNTASGVNSLRSGQLYTAGGFSVGTTYVIESVGTTNFTAIGASSNAVGVMFVATGVGSGTGTATSRMTGYQNTASGVDALLFNTTGINNTASGVGALYFNTTGINNTASGLNALYSNTTGSHNTASGVDALRNNTGSQNTASGAAALYSNTTGSYNTASGYAALYLNTTGINNTASGLNALYSNTTYSNCGGFGHDAQVSGSNQIKIGNSVTTTIVYNFQNLSDARDKTDIRDTELGLDFIKALRPVDYRWDYREDYRPDAPKFDLQKPDESASDDEKLAYEAAEQAHKAEMDAWLEAVKPANIVRDGSKKRIRYHHGLIAQEVKAVLDAKGVDFGGFQDHSVKGGEDVLSIGYIELIAPMIKAMQEQQAIIESLTARIAALEAKS